GAPVSDRGRERDGSSGGGTAAPVDEVLAPARGEDLPGPGAEVHLMGAAGVGMRGVAVLLGQAGYGVTGCDREADADVPEIEDAGGRWLGGHDPSHVTDAALVVRSSAVPEEHEELRAAVASGVPVWKRARALGALVNDRRVVGIAGTHGKTTITAMAAVASTAAGLDPTAVVGGRVSPWGHARPGGSDLAIVEADEYDRSFLTLDPWLAVVSSIEPEHLDTYGDLEGLVEAFRTFAGRAAGRDGVLFGADDQGARRLGGRLGDRALGYGFSEDAEFRVRRLGDPEETSSVGPGVAAQKGLLVWEQGELPFRLGTPGRHNLQNAAGALAAVLRLGADPGRLEDALAGFRGVDRRLQELYRGAGVVVVDDYAHHPTEVKAAISAMREGHPGHHVWAVFQPHLFSRTRLLHPGFADALAGADRGLVLPIYPAREDPIPGVTSSLIVDEAGPSVELVARDAALDRLEDSPTKGPAVWLFMGAGDVTELAHEAAGRARRADAGGTA
ncbi:MAG: UDP-N-acetylmuramate--L-alanine ligase, partial [Gemmatimonadota bacterium]